MQLYIPTVGTKFKLIEDFSYYVDYYSYVSYCDYFNINFEPKTETNKLITIPKDTILTVSAINNKKYNLINYMILKISKSKKLNQDEFTFRILISDVSNMNIDFLPCNDETFNIIKDLDLKSKMFLSYESQNIFMKIVLNGKTITTVCPQQTPDNFLRTLMNKYEKMINNETKLPKSDLNNINNFLITYIRKYKIICFLNN
jgi:hypothetical protein